MGILTKLTFSWTSLQGLASKPVTHDFNEVEYKVTINGYLNKTSEKEYIFVGCQTCLIVRTSRVDQNYIISSKIKAENFSNGFWEMEIDHLCVFTSYRNVIILLYINLVSIFFKEFLMILWRLGTCVSSISLHLGLP